MLETSPDVTIQLLQAIASLLLFILMVLCGIAINQ